MHINSVVTLQGERESIIIIGDKYLRVQDVGASYTQVRMRNGLRHYVYLLGYNMHAQYVAPSCYFF